MKRTDRAPNGSTRNSEVGYGKPPISGQFKKGQSGNPRGRPREKLRNGVELIAAVIDEKVLAQVDGKKVRMSRLEFTIRTLVVNSAKDPRSFKILLSILQEYKLIAPRQTRHVVRIEYVDAPPRPDHPGWNAGGPPRDNSRSSQKAPDQGNGDRRKNDK